MVSIKVKTLTGKEISIENLDRSKDTIMDIKKKVEEKEGISPEQQRLVFQGKAQRDDKTLEDVGADAGAVFHLVLQLRGGFSQ